MQSLETEFSILSQWACFDSEQCNQWRPSSVFYHSGRVLTVNNAISGDRVQYFITVGVF